MPTTPPDRTERLVELHERVLASTSPAEKPGRPAHSEVMRRMRGLHEIRALTFLTMSEMRGNLTPETCRLILEHGAAELREIGRHATIEAMTTAAKITAEEITRRLQQPRSGWDVYGNGERNPARKRIRDIVREVKSIGKNQ